LTKWTALLSDKNINTTVVTFLLVILTHVSAAQFQRFPLQRSGALNAPPKAQHSLARTKQTPALHLPFFDDFSKPFNTIYADTTKWTDSYSVWVNDGMGIRPPTINVATFDGLDSSGVAYNANDVLLTGYTDNLTSKAIDLTEVNVSLAERPTVYLSFFYQWQGNVEAPDAKDFLQLDFKTAEENGWQTVMTIFPREEPDRTMFYDTIIQISGEQFFHASFQFRFRSFGRLSGPFDAWNIDYVYVNKNRNINDLSFPDRALSTQLGPLFGEYRSIPRNHFFSNDQLTPPAFEIQNMKNVPSSYNFRTEGFFSSTDLDTDVTLPPYKTIISNVNAVDNVLLANEHKAVQLDTLPDINDPQQFPVDAGIDSTIIRLTIALQSRDNIPLNKVAPVEPDSTGDYTQNYSPIRFTTNDTLTADYVLSSYYAYDDGVAEYAAGLIESGNLVAYEFEMEFDSTTAVKQDTLIGFDIYFPPYAITSNQTVDFFIYHDEGGIPGDVWLRIPSKPVLRKGVNQFQRIEFLPALLINEKKFYIGWKEPVAGEVVVGLDLSNDTGEKMFVNTNGTWYRNDEVTGSLMLRPVFGSGIIDSSVGVEEEHGFSVYPNPNRGLFYIEGETLDLEVVSMTGERIPYELSSGNGRSEIKVNTQVPGLYLLRYRQGAAMRSKKIIIVR
jgi:hypothetical protein